jgi:ankyrin repeat protein
LDAEIPSYVPHVSQPPGAGPFLLALQRADLPRLKKQLKANPALANTRMMDGKTPLHGQADLELVRLLLDSGADPKIADFTGQTPLHGADDPALVKLLLAHGADPNAGDLEDRTPLHLAQDHDVKVLLLKAGADYMRRSKKGDYAVRLSWGEPNGEGEMLLKEAGVPLPKR